MKASGRITPDFSSNQLESVGDIDDFQIIMLIQYSSFVPPYCRLAGPVNKGGPSLSY